jgi:ATP-dependent RNA helicase RhlE
MMNKRSFSRPAGTGQHSSSRFSGGGRTVNNTAYRTAGGSKTTRHFSGGNFKNNIRRAPVKGGARRRFGGEHIDFSRFIKKAEYVEEKAYKAEHSFSDFNFYDQVEKNLTRKGFTGPRPIQDQAIPKILEGKDVFGLANTGTGKTAAFLLPLIDKIMKNKSGGRMGLNKVLIMAPTRELALQIESDFRELSYGLGIFSAACVGGLPINKQIQEIRRGVTFVIGTPGRLMDLLKRKVLDLSGCQSIVLDEADRMLDMGFRPDMVAILSKVPKERQTLFFSATLSPEVKKLTAEFLNDPVFISVISGETAKNIDQDIIRTKTKEEKIEKLHEVLNKKGSDKVLIFREMKHSVDSLTRELSERGFKVGCIHGNKRSRERIRTLDLFKQDHIQILVATDVAARGLDIPDVTHVINYDIPQNYQTYVHRIGRTGRSGKKGIALTFV